MQNSSDLDRNDGLGEPDETVSATLADLGRDLLARAHEILAESDKRLRSSDTIGQDGPIRIGISSMLLSFLVDHPANALLANAIVTSDICSRIVKAFDDEDVDVAMVMDVKDHRLILGDHIVAEFGIEFAWMKAETLEFQADQPIPLAIWPPDQHIILNALSESLRAYKVMFSGPDYSSKFTAARSGHCLAVVPRHAIAPPFVEAEGDLPEIAPKTILLALRGDRNSQRFAQVVSLLSSLHLSGPSLHH